MPDHGLVHHSSIFIEEDPVAIGERGVVSVYEMLSPVDLVWTRRKYVMDNLDLRRVNSRPPDKAITP